MEIIQDEVLMEVTRFKYSKHDYVRLSSFFINLRNCTSIMSFIRLQQRQGRERNTASYEDQCARLRSIDQERIPTLMHDTVHLFIGVEYNFSEFTIMP
jgi:hypothetical protein